MAVHCARCGEELLGAVNRCWKCGQEFRARPTVEGLPPVRDEVVAAAAVAALSTGEALEARVVDDSTTGGQAGNAQTAAQSIQPAAPTAMLVAPPVRLPP